MTQLSVIVPCHNVEPYAAETLHSLALNAGEGIEFVLVDDASTDATPTILAEAAGRIPGATVLSLGVNVGLAAARNAGLEVATGRYLSFLDGDDVIAPGYLADLLRAIQWLGCDFVRTDHVQVRGREREVHRVPFGPRNVVVPARSGIGPADRRSAVDAPNAWAGVADRRLLDSGLLRFDEELRTCEDRPWIWRLHLEAESFAVVGLLGVRYRREVQTSLTQVTDERQLDYIRAFEAIIAAVRADPEADRFLPKAIRSFCAMACHHVNQLERYPLQLGRQLVDATGQALARLPEAELAVAMAHLDAPRAGMINQLRSAA